MKTLIEVKDTKQLMNHIKRTWSYPYCDAPLEIKHYCYDKRIGWDCYIVSCGIGVIGFLDGKFDNEKIEIKEHTDSGRRSQIMKDLEKKWEQQKKGIDQT